MGALVCFELTDAVGVGLVLGFELGDLVVQMAAVADATEGREADGDKADPTEEGTDQQGPDPVLRGLGHEP